MRSRPWSDLLAKPGDHHSDKRPNISSLRGELRPASVAGFLADLFHMQPSVSVVSDMDEPYCDGQFVGGAGEATQTCNSLENRKLGQHSMPQVAADSRTGHH
jgi:hypothetical protein